MRQVVMEHEHPLRRRNQRIQDVNTLQDQIKQLHLASVENQRQLLQQHIFKVLTPNVNYLTNLLMNRLL